MATDLLKEVETALGMASHVDYASRAKQHDLYEAYVLTLLLEAAVAEQWDLELTDGWRRPVSSPLFRLGPGRITSRKFTIVRLTKDGRPDLECHLGVKVSGRTHVGVSEATASGRLLHEFDLLVLPASVAHACRSGRTDPDYSSVTIHGEMKYYGGKLSLPLGRASVGMATECVLSGKSVLVTNQLGYTVQDLVAGYGVELRYRILPSNSFAEQKLVSWFRSLL